MTDPLEALWVELERCLVTDDAAGTCEWDPQTSRDPVVARIWNQITHPRNGRSLAARLERDLDSHARDVTAAALEESRRRGEKRRR